jgi:Ser-tRNA(Ala) deacylase AlaX
MGRINGYKVIGLKKDAEEIWYIVGRQPSFREGELVDLEIDWNRRYLMMRLHSALHLWAGVFEAKFNERALARVLKSDRTYVVFKHELPNEIIDEDQKHKLTIRVQ